MGASGWDYVTRYDGNVEAALATLQARVFQEEYGDGARYRSLENLYEDEEFMGTEGKHPYDPRHRQGCCHRCPADAVRYR